MNRPEGSGSGAPPPSGGEARGDRPERSGRGRRGRRRGRRGGGGGGGRESGAAQGGLPLGNERNGHAEGFSAESGAPSETSAPEREHEPAAPREFHPEPRDNTVAHEPTTLAHFEPAPKPEAPNKPYVVWSSAPPDSSGGGGGGGRGTEE